MAANERFDDAPAPTGLEYLRSVLADRRKAEVRRIKLRDTMSRPELLFTCRVPSDSVEFAGLVKRAEHLEKQKDALPGGLLVACMTLARYTEQVTLDGRPLAHGDGSAFASEQLQEVLGVTGAWQAVRALVDDDFAVIRLFDQLTEEAGIGAKAVSVDDDGEPEDPI